ncbi:MAG: hypothetical protein H6621_08715 [Halobacteriovoraceae bacterium]|nr:hypothetical protein [Halobacteriovoraceae bacterium]MCB9095135.1 hypothetical protein [Halobacteriovoraceae bacterium]
MKKLNIILINIFIFHLTGWSADTLVKDDNVIKCVTRDSDSLYEKLKHLEDIHFVDNGDDNGSSDGHMKSQIPVTNIPYALKVLFFNKPITLIDMVKSSTYSIEELLSSEKLKKLNPNEDFHKTPGSEDDVALWVSLRPLPYWAPNISGELYPKFMLRCVQSDRSINCHQLAHHKGFSVKNFKLNLHVPKRADNKHCLPGETEVVLSYSVVILEKAYDQIKKAAARDISSYFPNAVESIVEILFTPEDFFKTYWQDFFDRWVTKEHH